MVVIIYLLPIVAQQLLRSRDFIYGCPDIIKGRHHWNSIESFLGSSNLKAANLDTRHPITIYIVSNVTRFSSNLNPENIIG